MHDWFSHLPLKRLLVVGDLMLDRYTWGLAERISPEAPVIVLQQENDEVRPGGAANVASFLRGLDAEVVLAGVVGDDAEGRSLRQLLIDKSIDAQHVLVDGARPTTTKNRIIGRSAQRQPHQILRVDREARRPVSVDCQQQLTEKVLNELRGCEAVLISDYGKGVCSTELIQAIIKATRRRGIPVTVDPCRGVDYRRYTDATIISPNRSAAEQALRQFPDFPGQIPLADPVSILAAARCLQHQLKLDAAVLTLDRDGLAYATATETGIVRCRPREVCDVTGAGDMVAAILGLCQAARIPLMESLHLANAAAGLEVERFGVEPLSRAEILREWIKSETDFPRAVPHDQLLRQIQAERRAGRRIVFTNGCFDLLHGGHLAVLEEAASLGDILIVAINSDASVRALKGPDRPIIDEHHRARLLAALACVDYVVVFDDATPERLLESIRPDVLVKGGTTGHIVGREIVEAYGGRVVRTQAISGLSTTELVKQIRQPSANGTTESRTTEP